MTGELAPQTPGEARAPYVVLARKYRPQTFDSLIGQEAMVRTLRNAFAAGRIAQGYMLTGVRGVGKTTTARILARAMNYSREGAPDVPAIDMPVPGRHCAEIMEGRHPDVLEMDAASNTGIDNIREVIENARYRPLTARYKVFIIDEVHMLSKGAFNALLKTLEEPPGHARFIFATTEIRKVPVTVLSRCQRFDLRRVDVPALAAHLGMIAGKEGARAEDEALRLIARAAEGSVRDALSLLDQAIAMGEGAVTAAAVRAMLGLADRGRIFDLLEHLLRGAAAQALASMAALYQDGAEPVEVMTGLAEAVHAVARCKAAGAGSLQAEMLSPEERQRTEKLAARLSIPVLTRAFQMLIKGIDEVGRARNPAAAADMVLIRLAYVADLPPPDAVLALFEREGQGAAGAQKGAQTMTPGGGMAAARQEDGRGVEALQYDTTTGGVPESGLTGNIDSPAGAGLAALPGEPAAGSGARQEAAAPAAPESPQSRPPQTDSKNRVATFAGVVALAGEKREARLKVYLEDHVSLVKFDPAGRTAEIFLLPGAPAGLPGELAAKLTQWTGERWMVILSPHAGAPPLGEARRQREAAARAKVEQHPAVRAVLEAFPGARLGEVRPLAPLPAEVGVEDESAAG